MVTDSLRVIVFARHQLLAQALIEVLAAEPGLDVVELPVRASGVPEDIDVDVLVADLEETPGGISLDLARSALEHHPGLGVVVICEPGPTRLTREALELGVRGWVSSDEPLTHLVAAVRAVGAHGVCIPVTVLTSALATVTPVPGKGPAGLRLLRLTPRQTDVLRCLVEGRSRAQTGAALEMSDNTVRTHVGAILRRLQVHSIIAAVAVAREADLIGRSAETAPTAKSVARLGR
ncbi:MAG: response regulator transcription factor [Actinomycetota bacterium]|nr:response regulator transcription factor [Actinomycetota bacterium]